MNPADIYIALPPCYDATGSAVFWVLMLSCFAGKLVHVVITKFDLFDEDARPWLIAALIIGLSSLGLFFEFWNDFVAVRVQERAVVLEYLWPRSPLMLDAVTIDDVSIQTDLQLYKPGRRWKHSLIIETNHKQTYASRSVCIPMNKVGTDYQSAVFTKLNDPVEKAEEAVEECAIKAKFARAGVKDINPFSYLRMYVRSLRNYSNIAADPEASGQQRQAAIQKLNDYLAITKKAFGDKHCLVAVVYQFIGRSYGFRGDMVNAKIAFAEADKCDYPKGQWYSACDRINPNGMDMNYFEHPDWPRTPNSALDF